MSVKIFLVFSSLLAAVTCQDCAIGWVKYNNRCWYFSQEEIGEELKTSWTQAESWCQSQSNKGHLASFATVEERDWAYNNYLQNFDNSKWWIGFNDLNGENTFEWTDGTTVNDDVVNWKVNEPSNSGKEDCVEVWNDPPLYKGVWNDRDCDAVNPFICSAPPGSFEASCPVEWTKQGDKCYKIINTENSWHYADADCRSQGGFLASIASQTEQTNIQSLISVQQQNIWIGYSDQGNPGVLQWSDPSTQGSTYTYWAANEPPTPLNYVGSTCVVLGYGVSYMWVTTKCGGENKYVCQRGLSGNCPYGWNLLAGKCYEIIVNQNKVETWTTANEVCTAEGAKLLKIESPDQQKYIGSLLVQFQKIGYQNIWLGGSDLAKDDTYAWGDGTQIQTFYWDVGMPNSVKGREDCMTLYTGKTTNNWETSGCFDQLPFVCELPEGTTLPTVPAQSVEGKCESGWRHFKPYCYFFGTGETTQSEASSYCTQNTALLTSITSVNELSFIVGHLGNPSWIGLQYQGGEYKWVDGQPLNFKNWGESYPTQKSCVYSMENGDWADVPCSEVYSFVCKKDEIRTPVQEITPTPGGPADVEKCGGGGWFSDPASTQCYFINAAQVRSWDDARYSCQSIGGDLVGINSPAEQAFVFAATAGLGTVANIWIGAWAPSYINNIESDVADGGWRWSDESPFNYLNWNSGEPNNQGGEDCGELYVENGEWNDQSCLEYRHYMCEKTGNTNGVGTDIEDENCKSNEACCFKHLGVEYGGALPDSALTGSSEKSDVYGASRGRLNTPADVIVVNDDIHIGTGHGAWVPKGSDTQPWLQVDFESHMEIKGIITQGRNGLIQYTEREWTTSYKISYSQDPDNKGADVQEWEWLSDQDGNPIIFDGNSDQNTQVTNLFPRPVIARHVRCHAVTWKEEPALRLEYIGCFASCLFKLGMSSGLITDNMITASSSSGGKTPQQARAPIDKTECLASAQDHGGNYRGWISKTNDGIACQLWSDQYPHAHQFTSQNYPDAGLNSNFCRNPDGKSQPWCYTTDPNVEWDYCDIPICPSYTPSGWSPSSSTTNQYVQVQFSDFYKVSGVTLYGNTANYVTKYVVYFSDDGMNFASYKAQSGAEHLFFGLDGVGIEYTDVLREPISTKYIRIQPREWVGGAIVMQFEINGCYVDRRITCSDVGTDFTDTTFTVDCPAGCIEDLSSGLVYGTTEYTENSAVCPAALHAGRITDQHGGSVTVVKTSGEASYTGSYQNGIQSLDASASHLSITFDGSVYRCEDGWQPWKDHCYYLSMKTVFKNWHDAREDCLSMGADLTSIHSSGENDFHEYMITQGDRGGDVWIGMNDLRTQNYYEWADDTTVVWTKWNANEPNGGNERCVQIYRLFGTWNDENCESEFSYICKKEKERLPPLDPGEIQTDEGCDPGWTAFGSSCYQASGDEYIFIYGNRICEESGAKLVSIHNTQEQAFVHSLVTNTIPPGLGYTAWIGLSAKTAEQGQLYYTWETGEPVSFTYWDVGEPDVQFSCAFPFEYKGVEYTECITFDHPAKLQDTPWCSIDPVYAGRWINCDTGYEYGCAFMNDQTGFWQIDICGQNRYYVCEKDRVGYTQPSLTTPSTSGTCVSGWYGDETTTHCYQINEYTQDDITQRLTWSGALDFCRTQGADLVSVHSVEEQTAISKFVINMNVYSYVYFWLGLNNIDLENGYQWTDGSPVDYTSWSSGEPNNNQGLENCVESQFYTADSGWNDLSCDSLRNYICKIPKGKNPKPAPTVPPLEGNENDPACGSDPDGTWVRYQPSYGADKCYMFLDTMENGWQYAENMCIQKGGHLVSIHSSDENKFILGRISVTSRGIFWVGLRDVGGRSFFWADGSTLDFVFWASGEPNNYYDSEGCVTFYKDGGIWNDDNCGRLFPFICEKIVGSTANTIPPTQQVLGNCPTGFTAYGNKCYMTGGDEKYTWEQSREWCKTNAADLVTITNSYEQSFLNNFLYGTGVTFWTGLSDRFTNNGQFVWIDQTEVSYTNWAPGEPSGEQEGCAVINMDRNGYWEDNNCSAINSFICFTDKSAAYDPPAKTESPIGCPSGYYTSTHEQACYMLVDTPMSWNDAQQYCRSQGDRIDLASINEIYDNDLVNSWFWHDVTSGTSVWIGLSFDTVTSNGVTDTKFSWSDQWPVDYTNWGPNEPDIDTLISGSGCARINNGGYWDAVPQTGSGATCATALPFACKKSYGEIPTTPEPPSGVCPPNFFGSGEFCYFIEYGRSDATTRSWYEASYMCEELGATLASFHSDDEVQEIQKVTSTVSSHNLYIGLSSNGFSGWSWVDGTSADYFNWGPHEPNGEQNGEECVEQYPWDGTWNDVDCFNPRGYICKTTRENTRCTVHITQRIDCGKDLDDIDQYYCVSRRGCCWDETYKSGNYSGCFYPQDVIIGPSGVPVVPTSETVSSGGLSGGAVAGIIIGVLLAIAIGGFAIYYFCCSSNKSLSSVSLPSIPAVWSTSGKSSAAATTTSTKDNSGFDNPMALSDDGTFHAVP